MVAHGDVARSGGSGRPLIGEVVSLGQGPHAGAGWSVAMRSAYSAPAEAFNGSASTTKSRGCTRSRPPVWVVTMPISRAHRLPLRGHVLGSAPAPRGGQGHVLGLFDADSRRTPPVTAERRQPSPI